MKGILCPPMAKMEEWLVMSGSHKLTRTNFLVCVSVIALSACLTPWRVAHAADPVLRDVVSGADGREFTILAGQPVDSTEGASAGSLTRGLAFRMLSPASTTAVEIGSRGGNGALGAPLTSSGIYASSFASAGKAGGNAGNVWLALLGTFKGDGSQSQNAALVYLYSIGGDGRVGTPGIGKGGRAGTVTLDLGADISTKGDNFFGVWARSKGGQSGRNQPYDGQFYVPFAFAKPADAGEYAGANGNKVDVTIRAEASVITHGKGAHAVVLESIGGSGLDGGRKHDEVLTRGGDGGEVRLANSGLIATNGSGSAGLLLQSVGGHGGDQVYVPLGIQIGDATGGSGANGGNGGRVSVGQAGSIDTRQDYSFGVSAASMGGVGGVGNDSTGIHVGSAGNGGNAGNGGKVDVVNTGEVRTAGKGSVGIAAQSLGGGSALGALQTEDIRPGSYTGGGAGGSLIGLSLDGEAGQGGSGGNGGNVQIRNAGTISTSGASAHGILAQSVGGGGGAGGDSATAFSVLLGAATRVTSGSSSGGAGGGGAGAGGAGGNGGVVEILPSYDSRGQIETTGDNASGIVAQSIGGGGGVGGIAAAKAPGAPIAITIGIGGSGGDGGRGDLVSVINTSDISTAGNTSHGIEASSIGGGGGRGGDASSYTAAVGLPGVVAGGVTFAIGGAGGNGGSGGGVNLLNLADVTTSGDNSIGLLASSIGGGGGNGATASALAEMLGVTANVGVTIGVGGSGGGGGGGGAVRVSNGGKIETSGEFAPGVQAVSIGGGGGNGGSGKATSSTGIKQGEILSTLSDAVPTGASLGINVSVGGSGGGGGNGGEVTADNLGSITTRRESSTGMLAQSVGGGGGNGGGYVSGGKTSFSARIGVGGSGGKGGDGGAVTATNATGAVISTSGDGSVGLHAQSIGGGGGNGGAYGAATPQKTEKSAGASASGSFLLKMADALIKGNDLAAKLFGKKVSFLDSDSLFQQRVSDAAFAVKTIKSALSSAADATARPVPVKPPSTFAAARDNDDDATVSAKSTAEIFLDSIRESSRAAAMEYIIGDFASRAKNALKSAIGSRRLKSPIPLPLTLDMQVGGTGGDGGNGGPAAARNDGGIETSGAAAAAMLAQSIGGGGGTAGGGVTLGPDMLDVKGTLGSRSAGADGNGGRVTVNNTGLLRTSGNASFGMVAQSIGGGGGIVTAVSNAAMTGTMNVTMTLGSTSTAMANGGDVAVSNTGAIATSGRDAHGIVAQSIGGGGGMYIVNRQSVLGAEALATSETEAQALSDLEDILALAAERTGNADIDLRASLAAAAASEVPSASVKAQFGGIGANRTDAFGGSGANVSVEYLGSIRTTGVGAIGIVGQSIGGGGGLGADASGLSTPVHFELSFGGVPLAVNDTPASGDGGSVSLSFGKGASIVTKGAGAHGVLLQSIGGGGGYGGVGTGTISRASLAESVADVDWRDVGLRTASYGNGGDISVGMARWPNGPMSIETSGARAHGLYIQSLAGGGGAAFDVNGANVAPVTDTAGQPAVVDYIYAPFTANGSPYVYDPGAVYGVAASLLGVGHAGRVSIDTQGTINATGRDAYGIFVQNGRQKTDGSIDPRVPGWSGTVSIRNEGTIWGGSGTGAGIRIDGAGSNSITVPWNSALGAKSGVAIISRLGTTTITNAGLIEGDVLLSSSASNPFVNEANGTYRSRAGKGTLDLGLTGLFTNRGTLDIGGIGRVSDLSVSSRALLGGQMLADVRSTAKGITSADLLSVYNLTFDGVNIRPSAVDGLLPGSYRVIEWLMKSGSGAPTVTNYGGVPISWNSGIQRNAVILTPSANFLTPDTANWNANERNLAATYQTAWNASSSGEAPVFAQLANLTSAGSYRQAMDSLSSEEQLSPATTQTLAARGAMNAALSCPIFVDNSVMITESECAWARVTGSRIHASDNAVADGFTQTGVTMRLGAQWEVADNWFMGVTGAYTNTSLDSNDGYTRTDGDSGDLAVSIKHQVGPWLFAASAEASFGVFDTTRYFNFESASPSDTSTSNIWTAGLRLRAAYELPLPNESFYLRPYVDLDAIYTHMPGYQVGLSAGSHLNVGTLQDWTFALTPALEFGARIDLDDGSWLRPYAMAGMTFLFENDTSVTASFDTALAQGIDFTTQSPLPDTLFDIGAGLQFMSNDTYELRGEYRAQIGSDYLGQEASLRFSVRF